MTGIVRKGDQLSSGGKVLAGSHKCEFMGKAAARVGDSVYCAAHGYNRIAQGTSHAVDFGAAIAQHGDLCECGCYLISSLPGSGPR
jgi:uncharacterized Zn-binding protein involved in type VI secretion